ncbi:hypothetical protein ASPACDRAFT_62689 [Aspergillus aculeatus ATCC 16872]|uniref:Glycosyl transferase CAP10 domain-containing protein n=1 Tax=Aspergillus aculeatus (strain ATCC 16872 / CBS 172.66 / WB 5094) TaxID=690307 RepID=A0A1L9WNH0_ASPA1|nr:uncharacterized protein ASPACDRAFT_62689 [Aspergillus aculeatus ATCC 16872]OJJ97719.1 hypothetical protein ASPACDRAFT_62689 [Aspergillus aculeatus ATCC 16872]
MYTISKAHLLAAAAVLSLIFTTFLIFGTQYSTSVAKYALKTSLQTGGCAPPPVELPMSSNTTSAWEFQVARDGNNYGLTAPQCRAAFPKLFVEIDNSTATRAQNPIRFEELDQIEMADGMVRGMIADGQLYIISYTPQPVTFSRAKATLHALHRALAASPTPLPPLEFILTTEDFYLPPTTSQPTTAGGSPIWSYTKLPHHRHTWLMPDFGYWSWPEVAIGPYRALRTRIAALEASLPFPQKRKQLLWRGSTATNPAVRGTLLKAAQGKSWSSVHTLDWDSTSESSAGSGSGSGSGSGLPEAFLPMHEHCGYMFLAHTEGRSFSGRGKYLLNCKSVVLSHPLSWREAHHAALVAAPHPEANYVVVEEEGWGDLDAKMRWLIDHPEVAERIAEEAVRTFRDRYLTPAAEACYWRELVAAYSRVLGFVPVLEGREGVVAFEDWVLGVS